MAQTFRNETTELVTVTAGDDVIEATPEHPFYVPGCDEPRANSTRYGDNWIKAKDLRQGDVLVLLDGSAITVDSVTTRTLFKPITVYNFEVEDFHTYFVGNNGLLVHNVCYTDKVVQQMASDVATHRLNGKYGYVFCEKYAHKTNVYHVRNYGTSDGLVPCVRWDKNSGQFIKSTATGILIHEGTVNSRFNNPTSMGCIIVEGGWSEFYQFVGTSSGTLFVYGPNRYD